MVNINRNNGLYTQEVLLAHRLSFGRTRGSRVRDHEGLELGIKGARVRKIGFSMIDMTLIAEFSIQTLWC